MNVYVIVEHQTHHDGVIGVYATLEQAQAAVERLVANTIKAAEWKLDAWPAERKRWSFKTGNSKFDALVRFTVEEWPLLGLEDT